MSRHILVLCGSFSPPTFGHFILLKASINHLKTIGIEVEKCIISPASSLYPKIPPLLPSKHRVALCSLMSRWSSEHLDIRVDISTNECNSSTWRTTVDVLAQIQQENEGKKIHFLCGSDLIYSWNKVGLWSVSDCIQIVEKFNPIVCFREGYGHDFEEDSSATTTTRQIIFQRMSQKMKGDIKYSSFIDWDKIIFFKDATISDLSSTYVRHLLSIYDNIVTHVSDELNMKVLKCISQECLEYIEENNLYT